MTQSSVAALFDWGVHDLAERSESSRADVSLLMAHAMGRSRGWLVAQPDALLSEEQIAAFVELCNRRKRGEPIAYILGSAGFYGREFLVNDRVLVPRPETEHLVEDALGFIRGPVRVLDVGTGCGAIACTIAAETDATVDADDVSPAAIEIATENARRLGVGDRCSFYRGDLVEPVRGNRYDVVIANLPYVPTGDLPERPEPASFEPREALDGGPDGLGPYRRLLAELPALLGDRALTLLEAAPPTISQLAELVRRALRDWVVTVCNDYAGLARYVRASASPGAAGGPAAGIGPGAVATGRSR